MASSSEDPDGLLDNIDKKQVYAKDLGMIADYIPGNPFCRYTVENGHRKYCSRNLFEEAADKFVIPKGEKTPRPLVECDCCGKDSYRTDNDECGRCGKPMFDCPKCDEEIHGKPDECPSCGAPYKWE